MICAFFCMCMWETIYRDHMVETLRAKDDVPWTTVARDEKCVGTETPHFQMNPFYESMGCRISMSFKSEMTKWRF